MILLAPTSRCILMIPFLINGGRVILMLPHCSISQSITQYRNIITIVRRWVLVRKQAGWIKIK